MSCPYCKQWSSDSRVHRSCVRTWLEELLRRHADEVRRQVEVRLGAVTNEDTKVRHAVGMEVGQMILATGSDRNGVWGLFERWWKFCVDGDMPTSEEFLAYKSAPAPKAATERPRHAAVPEPTLAS